MRRGTLVGIDFKKERNQRRPGVGPTLRTAGGLPGTVRPVGVPPTCPLGSGLLDVWCS